MKVCKTNSKWFAVRNLNKMEFNMTATTVVTRGTGTATAAVAVFAAPTVGTVAVAVVAPVAGRKNGLFGSVQL